MVHEVFASHQLYRDFRSTLSYEREYLLGRDEYKLICVDGTVYFCSVTEDR